MWVQPLAPLSELRSSIACCDSWYRGHRQGLDPTLLWLWNRLVATAPIQPLAWKLPYALGAALKDKKQNKKKQQQQQQNKANVHT